MHTRRYMGFGNIRHLGVIGLRGWISYKDVSHMLKSNSITMRSISNRCAMRSRFQKSIHTSSFSRYFSRYFNRCSNQLRVFSADIWGAGSWRGRGDSCEGDKQYVRTDQSYIEVQVRTRHTKVSRGWRLHRTAVDDDICLRIAWDRLRLPRSSE